MVTMPCVARGTLNNQYWKTLQVYMWILLWPVNDNYYALTHAHKYDYWTHPQIWLLDTPTNMIIGLIHVLLLWIQAWTHALKHEYHTRTRLDTKSVPLTWWPVKVKMGLSVCPLSIFIEAPLALGASSNKACFDRSHTWTLPASDQLAAIVREGRGAI